MAFGIVDLNTAMTGINDINIIKHQEDNKGAVMQNNIQHQMEQGVEVKLTHVRQADDVHENSKKFDAREKGSNEYHGNGGENRKKKEDNPDGKVVPKYSGFDIKI